MNLIEENHNFYNMEIKVNNKEFVSALSIGGAMAGRVKSLPILDCVKIAVKNGYAVITSFDNESVISNRTSIVSTDEQGEFCINPKDLGGILKTIQDEEISLIIGDTSCEVVHSKGSLSLPVLPASDFPTPSKDEDVKLVRVSAEGFFNALKNAQRYVDNSDLRPALTGIYIEVEGNKITLAASDSHKLFYDELYTCDVIEEKINGILPSKAIPAVLSALNGEESINVLFGEKNIVIRASDTKIQCLKIVGRYPNIRSVIPTNNDRKIKVDKLSLKSTVERALLAANMTSKILKLSISPFGDFGIMSEDLGFGKKCEEKLECEVNGFIEDFTIGCKGDLLLDGINSIVSDNVEMSFSEPKKAFLILDEENPNKKILIMPVSLN